MALEKSETGKEERIRILFGCEPDIIAILSGAMKKRADGTYRTAGYPDLDEKGLPTGGRARVLAAAHVAHVFRDAFILTNSGVPDNHPNGPTEAELNAKELEELGVSSQILTQDETFSTIGELIALAQVVTEQSLEHPAILTSDYHVERVLETLKRLETFIPEGEDAIRYAVHNLQQKGVKVIGAEDILSIVSSHYARLIGKVHESKPYRDRVDAEKRGIDDLQNNRYKPYQKGSIKAVTIQWR